MFTIWYKTVNFDGGSQSQVIDNSSKCPLKFFWKLFEYRDDSFYHNFYCKVLCHIVQYILWLLPVMGDGMWVHCEVWCRDNGPFRLSIPPNITACQNISKLVEHNQPCGYLNTGVTAAVGGKVIVSWLIQR